MRDRADKIAAWLADYLKTSVAERYVVGISGGVDSALAAKLAVMGCGRDAVYGLILPCHSSREDKAAAAQVVEWLQIDYREIRLTLVQDEFVRLGIIQYENTDSVNKAYGNLKSRLRMCALYLYANANNGLVLGTSNRSELEIGYFTKYGDGGVDVEPLANLPKTDVWEMAQLLDMPEKIVGRPPTAGLWAGQTDENELGMTYQELDLILRELPAERSYPELAKEFRKVNNMRYYNKHKLAAPIQCPY